MRDSNWQSDRQSILKKYDANGDGVYDTDEVNAIVDDYMATIKNNNALIDTNEGQKKLLIFSSIMILILSISNLGTAFLAVNLAKDTRVSEDGTMKSTGNEKGIKTMNTAECLTVPAKVFPSGQMSSQSMRRNRKLAQEVEFDFSACFTEDEVMSMYNNAREGSGTSLTLQDETNPSLEKTVFVGGEVLRKSMDEDNFERRLSEGGTADYVTDFEYFFPDLGLVFEYAPDACAERRKLSDCSLGGEGVAMFTGVTTAKEQADDLM